MKTISTIVLAVSFLTLIHGCYQIHSLQLQVQKTQTSMQIPMTIIIELFGGLIACIIGSLMYGKYEDIHISTNLLKKNRSHYMTFPAFQPLPPKLD